MSLKSSYLYAIALLLLAINLLVGNGLTSLWDGAESAIAWQLLHSEGGYSLQAQFLALATGGVLDEFRLRLPGAALVFLALPLYYMLARRLVGTEVVLNTLALAAGSLLLPNLAKVASGDIWAMLLQWLSFAALVRYLKQPDWGWQLGFYGLFALAIWNQPIQALVFVLGAAAFLYAQHPQGRRLWRLNPWAMGLLSAGALYALQLLDTEGYTFYFGFRTSRFLLYNLLGVLPFLGFVLSGLWEHGQRFRKGEELSILYTGGVLAALLGHSLALHPLLLMIAARQLRNYFADSFPYRGIVKAGAVLHLVAAACFLIVFMMGSFLQFRGIGFQAGLATGGLYWAASFLAVIGLVGLRPKYVLAGTVFSGVLLTTAFWIQFSPLMETQRQWAVQIAEDAAAQADGRIIVSPASEMPFPNVAVYAKAAEQRTALVEAPELPREGWLGAAPVYLMPQAVFPAVDTLRNDTAVYRGWRAPLQTVVWIRWPAGRQAD